MGNTRKMPIIKKLSSLKTTIVCRGRKRERKREGKVVWLVSKEEGKKENHKNLFNIFFLSLSRIFLSCCYRCFLKQHIIAKGRRWDGMGGKSILTLHYDTTYCVLNLCLSHIVIDTKGKFSSIFLIFFPSAFLFTLLLAFPSTSTSCLHKFTQNIENKNEGKELFFFY